MEHRKLDVSTGAGGQVAVRRARFDSHMNDCKSCQTTGMCPTAQTLWRSVVTTAMRVRQGQS